jgi:hypothetical protein
MHQKLKLSSHLKRVRRHRAKQREQLEKHYNFQGEYMPVPSKVSEDELIARAIAPRVSKIEIDTILNEGITLYDHAHHPLTLAIFRHPNGFWFVGHSAPASPENYDQEIGERLALERVISQLWQMEGFALRSRLHEKELEDEANNPVPGPLGEGSIVTPQQVPEGVEPPKPRPGEEPDPIADEPPDGPEEDDPNAPDEEEDNPENANPGNEPPGGTAAASASGRREYGKTA